MGGLKDFEQVNEEYSNSHVTHKAEKIENKIINDILLQGAKGFIPSTPLLESPKGNDEERRLEQERRAYIDAYIQREAEKKSNEIAHKRLNDILSQGGHGSPPSTPLGSHTATQHVSPSPSPRRNRRQPSPPPRY